jgi:GAF domain-containing protein
MALDTSMRGPQQAPVRSEADGLPPSAAFSARWTETFLALLHDLRVDEEGAPSLERIATILVRHGARLVPGSECVISIVPPERPGSFSVLAGEGAWASTLRGREWPLEGTLNGRAMLGGMPVESTDAQAESATPEVLAPGDIESGRVVPLRLRELPADGRVTMGAIGFWRTGHRPYDDEERALIDTYGELSTALLHRAELLGAATRTARRLESAVELAVETSASLEPEPVIRRLLERSLDAVAADRASLCRIDGTVMTVVDIVDRERMVHGAVGRHEQPWHPAVARAVEERRPVAVGRIEEADLRGAWREGLRDVERSLFAPLVAEGEVVALLTLMRRADVPFTDADVSTVQLIGNIAALSLRNAERYAESRSAHDRSLLALLEIARHVDDTNELSDFFGRLTESVARLVHARGAAFFALEADGSLRLVERAHNVDTGVAASGQRVVLHRGTAPWRVTLDGEHIRDDTGASAAEWLPGLDASTVIAGPWRAGERLLGSVIAFDTTTASGFSDEDVWVLRIAALAAGLVVSHQETAARELQLVREARERVHEISVVQDAAQALSMAIEIEDVYREIVRSAAHVVTPPASLPRRATLLKVEEDAAVIVAEYDEAGQHTRQEKFDLGEHPALRQVVERGATVVIDLSAGDVAEPTARQMRDMGVRSRPCGSTTRSSPSSGCRRARSPASSRCTSSGSPPSPTWRRSPSATPAATGRRSARRCGGPSSRTSSPSSCGSPHTSSAGRSACCAGTSRCSRTAR